MKSPEKPRRNLTQAFEALCVVSPDETIKEEKSCHFEEDLIVPQPNLHRDLALGLSQACISRVSLYSIIHDINKEAMAMAAHDPLPEAEQCSPIVLASQDQPYHTRTTDTESVLIDEEKWLLNAVEGSPNDSVGSCPATFSQAMGEKEYDITAGSRTQLWKPSRSWWEAKSGKNPWIEPASHNKRWRYLWPLIHYHKFLAKCIKKLKRNGVDVKQSSQSVSVFLREEVCAVSDHLAAVSMFGSDRWMACLGHFVGWTLLTQEAVRDYQKYISMLPLRGLDEPGDVDSPVLRNQIDEAFLRTMQTQRDELREAATAALKTKKAESTTATMYSSPQVPRQIHGIRRPRYGYWYGYESYDSNSVHSELSANSYPQYDPYMYYYSDQQEGYLPEHYWCYYGHPPPMAEEPASPDAASEKDNSMNMSSSPYWSHLDQATLAMMATPAKVSPSTPRRGKSSDTPQQQQPYPNFPMIRNYNYHVPPSPATQFMMSYYSPYKISEGTDSTTTTESDSLETTSNTISA